MSFEKIQKRWLGNWKGTNLLHLSWLTPSDYHSPSHLAITPVANGKFLMFTYTWSHENTPHEGLLVLGYDAEQKVATAAWLDSWHMSNKIMSCQGTIEERGEVILQGYYEAPPGPDWGWRIVIATSGEELHLKMYNCTPEGEEELAVRAEYTQGV
ncbi:MAG: DUF1579 family protein [candidate division KSB1 bacterium]